MAKLTLENKNIYDITQRRVVAALREILSDPDFGLSLKTSMVQKLKKSIQAKKGGKVKDLNKVLKRHGL